MNFSDTTWTILGSVLSLVVATGGYFLIPIARRLLEAKLGVEKSNMIFAWASIAVRGAEQVLGAGAGGQKYIWAVEVLKGLADSHNIKLDSKTLEAAIEAGVHELKKEAKPDPAAVGNVVVASGAPVVVEPTVATNQEGS